MKDMFTTGDVAKLCKVAPRTASKWFDQGLIKGYRIPGSQDRRIPRAELARFMLRNGIPIPDPRILGGVTMLTLGVDRDDETFAPGLADLVQVQVHHAASSFEAGLLFSALHPHILVVDTAIGRIESLAVAAAVRQHAQRGDVRLVGLVDEAAPADGIAGLFDTLLTRPVSGARLAACLARPLSA